MKFYEIDDTAVTDSPEDGVAETGVVPTLELGSGVSGNDKGLNLQGDPEDVEFGSAEDGDGLEGPTKIHALEEDTSVDDLLDVTTEQHKDDSDSEDTKDKLEATETDDEAQPTGRITDEKSFTDFYQTNAGYVLRLLVSGGLSPADAEDVAQTTFANAWKSRESFDGQNPRGWLTRIARNEATSLHRKEQRRPLQVTDEAQQDEAFRKAAGTERDPADVVVAREDAARVVQVMRGSGISEQWMSILWAKHGLGYEDHETAEALGISRGTVASGAHRAIRRVRESLEDQE